MICFVYVRHIFLVTAVTVIAGILVGGLFETGVLWGLVIAIPLFALGLHDTWQDRHALLRNYPVVGHGRYLMEAFRPEIQQYFVESNWDGRPFPREFRSIVYARAKGEVETTPFGTQRDVYRVGYEFMAHSLAPRHAAEVEPRIRIGGPDCRQPYDASHLNISAMSYGSLSANAVAALNHGARQRGFFHNTGEGGLSPYHLEPGGDLVWQLGTGYFGARRPDGGFDDEMFRDRVAHPNVKMTELKLSQGAKPGHGGILPARKVTPEISRIRSVPMGQDVLSPPAHREFNTPIGLLEMIARLRELSGGKPVGFKLCIGAPVEFLAIVKAMEVTGITPDFISVDGGEGGTGAAPLEFSNSVGMPLREALVFVRNALVGVELKSRIKLIAAGKIATGFHIMRALALGADLTCSARAMMFALGCIQARRCNANDCPVGVATQKPALTRGLVVDDKARRVARYHQETIDSFLELLGAAGLESPEQLTAEHIHRRVAMTEVQTFGELYQFVEPGGLHRSEAPAWMLKAWHAARPERFAAA